MSDCGAQQCILTIVPEKVSRDRRLSPLKRRSRQSTAGDPRTARFDPKETFGPAAVWRSLSVEIPTTMLASADEVIE
jgi:hypothetical protein